MRWVTRREACLPLLLLIVGLTCAGCGSKVGPVSGRSGKPPVVFAFISDGATTRARVVDELGEPAAEFESGRVLAYRLDESMETVKSLRNASFSLILVFDERDVLERHVLVRLF